MRRSQPDTRTLLPNSGLRVLEAVRGGFLIGLTLVLLGLGSSSEAQGGSPGRDGQIGFSHLSRRGALSIWVMNPDGSGMRRILRTEDDYVVFGAWSPNGSEFLYWDCAIRSCDLKLASSDGRRVKDLSGLPFTSDHQPSWSPDARRIVGSLDDDTGTGTCNLWVSSRGGKSARALTRRTRGRCDDWPDWSPDGRLIVFQRNRSLWLVRPDGTGLRRLTAGTPSCLGTRRQPHSVLGREPHDDHRSKNDAAEADRDGSAAR